MRIAIVGSGISGLSAAHHLRKRCQLTVFEAAAHAGGHSNTIEVAMDGRRLAIDTGFIVYNERNYPHFAALLAELGIATQPSDMSFSFRCARSGLEYRGDNTFEALFAQRRNLARPGHYRLLLGILRFNRHADRLLAAPPELSLGGFLGRHGFAGPVVNDYLLPMAGSIWSADPARILGFPAARFGRFFANHGLLKVDGRPQWRTITGGSREYVRAVVRGFREHLLLETPVEWLERHPGHVTLKARGRAPERFDHVILACHSDQALRLLRDPDDAERAVLGALRYQPNEAVLHTDTTLLPRSERARASWNYHRLAQTQAGRVGVTYNLTHLQSLATHRQILLTLNTPDAVDPRTVIERLDYEHPVFDAAACDAQTRLAEINGGRRTFFAGAYWGYGFHEDGVQSALAASAALDESLARSTEARGDAERHLSGSA